MDGAAHLTWYPGTVLPYASLWHTVLRVIALNQLSSGELPDGPGRVIGSSSITYRIIHLLHNDGLPVDTQQLAQWLGESPEAFRWSHLGFMPAWSRFLFTHGLRLCPQCTAAGYHSALLSLRLLDRCPIHGAALLDRCPCGRHFSESLGAFGYRHAGSCLCGELAFFTRETCRQPTLDPTLTQAFDPIVVWLERVAPLIRPKVTPREWQRHWDCSWTTLLPQWGEILGFGYPDLFVPPPEVNRRSLVVADSGRLAEGEHPPQRPGSRRQAPPPQNVSNRASPAACYWNPGPATWVYRSMARYLRRHVVRQSDRWVAAFQASANPLEVAQLLRTGRHALTSYADMLWSHRIEPDIEARRWPYRKIPIPPMQPGPEAKLLHERIGFVGRGGPLSDEHWPEAARDWMQYQMAGTALLSLWHDAMARAATAAATGIANWEENTDLTDLCDWVAIGQPEGRLRFLSLSIERHWLVPLPRTGKTQRREQVRQAQALRWQALEAACRDSCLTWTPKEGWCVRASCVPDAVRWRCHRLLGLHGIHPRFWLYTSSGRFVARLCSYRLQATADTAQGAIEALRQSVRQYAKVYGTHDLGESPNPVPPQVPLRVADELAGQEQRADVERARQQFGFWRCASTVDHITRLYLQRRKVHAT